MSLVLCAQTAELADDCSNWSQKASWSKPVPLRLSKRGDSIPHTSKEGSTLLAGIGSTGSAGVRMNLCIAWEDELQTSLGELLSLVSLPVELSIVDQWPRILTGVLREANGALDRLDDSHFAEYLRVERQRAGSGRRTRRWPFPIVRFLQ